MKYIIVDSRRNEVLPRVPLHQLNVAQPTHVRTRWNLNKFTINHNHVIEEPTSLAGQVTEVQSNTSDL